MIETMQHRGPDDTGVYVDDGLMLGQCRLSIIDLKTGRQPIYNEDRSIVIVYNGEIYNFRELRAELETKGHTFSTNSDTEVVVHAYEEHGPRCVSLFNGMFAFALFDSKKKQLLLARDRQGIKPLYYTLFNGSLIFASEIKSILRFPGVPRTLDKQALACFLTLRYVPLRETMFQGIRKILPGHYAIFDKTGLRETCYWQLDPRPVNNEIADRTLLNIVEKSVERHMISDVPVGIYLSGGLDSATMVAVASRLTKEPLNTFCMGFGEQTDELEDARAISEHFGTAHHEIVIKDHLLDEFPEMIWHMDFPKRNLYPYYLARLASKHVKVVLSGLGGDELFAGYDFRYKALSDKNPSTVHEKVNSYLGTQARDVPADQEEVYGKSVPEKIHDCAQEFLTPFFNSAQPFMEQVLAADFNAKMIYDFLPVDDATSMAHSVETRVPFLDNELVDVAFTIPFTSKFRDGEGKYPLRRAMSAVLPKETLTKEKQGFGPNPYEVYKRELRDYSEKYLPRGRAEELGLVNGDWVRRTLGKAPSPELTPDYNKLWDCLALEVFLRTYFDGDLKRSPDWDAL
jgi:asparagine synthase (glutamine-hydrolysing)